MNLTDRVKNKSSQTEMTKLATMRKEEVRNEAKRSGRNPDLEGPFEGASEKFGTVILQWEDIQKQKRAFWWIVTGRVGGSLQIRMANI